MPLAPVRPTDSPRPWQPRFGLRGILLLMVVVSVMGAAGNYLVRALHGGRSFQLGFILFTLAAPLLVMVLVSLLQAILYRRR
ncbi:MAG: hypothetical protein AB7O38_14000 [Pirellulaceae bacterium]